MNIPQGYKQTELGIIPEDWDVKTIGSLGYTYSGLSGKKKSDFGSGNAKYIPFLNILTNTQIDTNNLESVCVSNTEHQNNVAKGDLFFNTSSETPEEVGMCAVLSKNCPNTYLNSFCFGFRPFENNGVNGIYLSYFFRGNNGRKLMSVLAQGATRYNLSKTNLLESSIYLPPIAEQRAIAEALSDVDGLIAALDKKIAKKRLVKQGAMQQLLTGKKRLPGFTDEWVEKKLGKISHIKTGSRNGDQAVENGKYPFFVRSQRVYAIDTYSFDGEAILVPGEGGIGNIFHYINGKFDFHQRVYKISDFANEVCGKFIYFYMSRYFGVYALSLTVKATVDSLRLPTFEEFVIHMPSNIKVQQAIATILSDMDKEIADLEAQRDKYRLLKSGMMQKLLTGQIRLKIE